MRVRCPHCSNPLEIVNEADLSDVSCPSCGSHFSLVSDVASTLTQRFESKTIGHFELKRRLGVGAFGEVWQAVDSQLHRSVAIKVPRNQDLDSEGSEKFFREARAAAQLKHPHIVSVHEVGREDGQVYIVSDLIEGVTLADRLTVGPLSCREAADLTIMIAEALHHAHEHKVIHRDLKPSNIMLDAEDKPYVMDFGLAKREAGEITMTVEGQLLGTPAYMSPEQAQGSGHLADRRSDVYSLGVILFEAITGERPFRGNSRMLIHQVLKDDPPSPRKLNSAIPADLETVILKCLEKDPDRRYDTAQALAADLQRWLGNKPIHAKPVNRMTKAKKWIQRHPTTSGLLTIIAIAIVALFGVGLWYQAQLSTALTESNLATAEAQQLTAEKSELLVLEQRARTEAELNLRKLTEAKQRLVKLTMNTGIQRLESQDFDEGIHMLAQSLQEISNDSEALNEAAFLNLSLWQERLLSVIALIKHPTELRALQFSPDGQLLLSAGLDRTARVTHSLTGQPAGPVLSHPHQVESAQMSADGSQVLTGCFDGSIRLFDRESGRSLFQPIDAGSLVRQVSFTGDQDRGMARGNDGKLTTFHCSTGKVFGLPGWEDLTWGWFDAHPSMNLFVAVESKSPTLRSWNFDEAAPAFEPIALPEIGRRVEFSPSGALLAVITESQVLVYTLDQPAEAPLTIAHRGVSSLAFSSSEERITTASYGGQVATWRLPEGRLVNSPLQFPGQVNLVKYVPHSDFISVSVSQQSMVRLWDPTSNTPVGQQLRQTHAVAFSPQGDLMAVGSRDQPLRILAVESMIAPDRLFPHQDLILASEFSPNGDRLLTGGQDEAARLWSLETGEQIGETLAFPNVVSALAFHPTGSRFSVGSWDGTVRLFDASDGSLLSDSMLHDNKVEDVEFSPDGRLLFSSGEDGMIRIWDSASGDPVGKPLKHETVLRSFAIDPQQRWVVAGAYGEEAILWDLESRAQRLKFPHPAADSVHIVAFHPEGDRVLTADNKGMVRIWDASTGKLLVDSIRHRNGLTSAYFSPDGTKLITGSYDETAVIWNASTGEKLATLVHSAPVVSVAFSPDGQMVLTGCDDETARLWHATTGTQLGPVIRHLGPIMVVKFSPSGRHVLTAHGTARLSEIPRLMISPAAVADWVQVLTGIAYRHDGTIEILDTGQWSEKKSALEQVANPELVPQRLSLSRLREDHNGETGPFGRIYRSFNPRPQGD